MSAKLGLRGFAYFLSREIASLLLAYHHKVKEDTLEFSVCLCMCLSLLVDKKAYWQGMMFHHNTDIIQAFSDPSNSISQGAIRKQTKGSIRLEPYRVALRSGYYISYVKKKTTTAG
jgi:hypothetical protein